MRLGNRCRSIAHFSYLCSGNATYYSNHDMFVDTWCGGVGLDSEWQKAG